MNETASTTKVGWIGRSVKVPEHLHDLFEDLSDDSEALQAKYANFCAAIHEEQKILAMRAKNLWIQAIFELKLEGQWRYKDGFVHPIDPLEQK
jgi:hypothetical protein